MKYRYTIYGEGRDGTTFDMGQSLNLSEALRRCNYLNGKMMAMIRHWTVGYIPTCLPTFYWVEATNG